MVELPDIQPGPNKNSVDILAKKWQRASGCLTINVVCFSLLILFTIIGSHGSPEAGFRGIDVLCFGVFIFIITTISSIIGLINAWTDVPSEEEVPKNIKKITIPGLIFSLLLPIVIFMYLGHREDVANQHNNDIFHEWHKGQGNNNDRPENNSD